MCMVHCHCMHTESEDSLWALFSSTTEVWRNELWSLDLAGTSSCWTITSPISMIYNSQVSVISLLFLVCKCCACVIVFRTWFWLAKYCKLIGLWASKRSSCLCLPSCHMSTGIMCRHHICLFTWVLEINSSTFTHWAILLVPSQVFIEITWDIETTFK